MRLTTLCYIENRGRYLMMHRTKKDGDENAGKWIGVGGHMEDGESPDECILREITEETGLKVSGLKLRGIITFILPDFGNELTFLYTACSESDFVPPCPEGETAWIPVGEIDKLELWDGDRIFLPMLSGGGDVFSLKLIYAPGGELIGHSFS